MTCTAAIATRLLSQKMGGRFGGSSCGPHLRRCRPVRPARLRLLRKLLTEPFCPTSGRPMRLANGIEQLSAVSAAAGAVVCDCLTPVTRARPHRSRLGAFDAPVGFATRACHEVVDRREVVHDSGLADPQGTTSSASSTPAPDARARMARRRGQRERMDRTRRAGVGLSTGRPGLVQDTNRFVRLPPGGEHAARPPQGVRNEISKRGRPLEPPPRPRCTREVAR